MCVFNLLQDIHQFALRQIDVYLSQARAQKNTHHYLLITPAAAGQGARLAGPPDPPGHLEPEFSGLNLHYVPPAGPAGPPARKLHPPGGEAGRTCRRPRPRRARRDKIRLAGWRETRRLAGSVSLVIASHAGAGFVRGSMPPSPSPRPEIDVCLSSPVIIGFASCPVPV